MIEEYDGIMIGKFKYDMPEGFVESAISHVIEICQKPNIFVENIVPTAPSSTLWSVDDRDKRLYELPLFKDFLTFIKPHILTYVQALGIIQEEAYVVGMWAVHYKPTQFVQKHNHVYSDCSTNYSGGTFIKREVHKNSSENDMVSIILYLNKPDNSGNLFIEMPNGVEHEFDLKAGDIIMFPSYSLMHRTSPNESNEDKYVIVLELAMKWITDDPMVGKTLEDI